MKKVFVIDNYDSFTYNLVHYLEELDCNVTVKRNDEFNLDEIEEYPLILLSPGPGIPDESGLLKEAIQHYAPTKNIWGVPRTTSNWRGFWCNSGKYGKSLPWNFNVCNYIGK